MILERIRPSKFLTADITLEGPFIGVQLCVIPQGRSVIESFSTGYTGEGFLASVYPHVLLQV